MPSESEKSRIGVHAEQQARRFLEEAGLVTVRQNFRCRMGEIDLIMNHRGVLVFVEVRFRSNERYGGAISSITSYKKKKIERAAYYYLSQFSVAPTCRFDVVALNAEGAIEWIQNAWEVMSR